MHEERWYDPDGFQQDAHPLLINLGDGGEEGENTGDHFMTLQQYSLVCTWGKMVHDSLHLLPSSSGGVRPSRRIAFAEEVSFRSPSESP